MSTLRRADELIALAPRNVEAYDIRGLALCGLALLEGPEHITEARSAFAQARAISRAPGLVRTAGRLLENLLKVDVHGHLMQMPDALSGE